jgi:hypothetical protein
MANELVKGRLTTCYVCYKAKTEYYIVGWAPACKACRITYLGWPDTPAKVINTTPTSTKKSAPKVAKKRVVKKPDDMSEEDWDQYVKQMKASLAKAAIRNVKATRTAAIRNVSGKGNKGIGIRKP